MLLLYFILSIDFYACFETCQFYINNIYSSYFDTKQSVLHNNVSSTFNADQDVNGFENNDTNIEVEEENKDISTIQKTKAFKIWPEYFS